MMSDSYYSSLKGHKKEIMHGWPILMYHKLGAAPKATKMPNLYVTQELFNRQLEEWKASGGRWTTLDERTTPGMIITFDDGFLNVLELGLQPLREVGCRAMQYLVPGLLGKTSEWDLSLGHMQEKLMSVENVCEWLAAGHQIGAHTMTHPHLTELALPLAKEEIQASKKSLEDIYGIPIKHFAYPYGDYNEAIRDLVVEAGFETATTCETGVNLPGIDPFQLQRYMARGPSRKLLQPWTWF